MKFPSPLNRHFFTKISGNDVKVIIRLAESGWVGLRWSGIPESLVGGWTNPSEKYESNWIISPNRGENKKSWKSPTRSQSLIFSPRFLRVIRCASFLLLVICWSCHQWSAFFGDLLVELNCKCWSPFLAGSQQPTFLQQQPAHLDAVHHKLRLQTELPRRGWTKLFTSCLLNHSRRSSSRWIGDLYSWPIQDTMPATGRHPNIANSYLILHIIYATSRVSPVKVGHAPFWRPLRGKMELQRLGRYAQLVFKSYEPQDPRKLHATPSCGKQESVRKTSPFFWGKIANTY